MDSDEKSQLERSYKSGFKINYTDDGNSTASSSSSSFDFLRGKNVETSSKISRKNSRMVFSWLNNFSKTEEKGEGQTKPDTQAQVVDTSYYDYVADRCRVGIGSANNSMFLKGPQVVIKSKTFK